MRRTLVISPRRRLVAFVGWLLVTLCAAVATGYGVWQTIGPAPQAAGSHRARPIDTGQVAATATVIPTPRVIRLTPESSFGSTAQPTTTPSATTQGEPATRAGTSGASADAEPTPSATPAAAELVSNGSFEGGPSAWYVEEGAVVVASTSAVEGTMVLQIASSGGYADQPVTTTPGETYRLTGSGRVTVPGDAGMLGVIYRDGTGARLMALEPPPIVFTRTRFRAKTLVFTVPAGVVDVKAYVFKEPGSGQFEIDAISVHAVVEP